MPEEKRGDNHYANALVVIYQIRNIIKHPIVLEMQNCEVF
jgi:hypothetical protein